MDTEIESRAFTPEDFQAFAARLKDETELYKQWREQSAFVDEPPRIGVEFGASLIDAEGRPAPCNDTVRSAATGQSLAFGLAQHTVRCDLSMPLAGRPFTALEKKLEQIAQDVATAVPSVRLGMFGIPPSLRVDDLGRDRVSKPLAEQALAARALLERNRHAKGLRIDGEAPLQLNEEDRLFEAAMTSMPLRMQVNTADAAAAYNASVLASAATVAAAANSPFLFGHRLWEETRIPLFEQAVVATPASGGHIGPYPRVNFGNGYGRDALYGIFVENRQHFPVLLPVRLSEPVERAPCLRLHNETVWRWNRPTIDFGDDGQPRLHVEHRVLAPGPSALDSAANAAFYFGLVQGLMAQEREASSARPSFDIAQANFYRAARQGLQAKLEGYGAEPITIAELILRQWLPLAARGLEQAGVDAADVDRYLSVVEGRVASGRTGAAWQTAWVERYGRDFEALTQAYLDNQASGLAVHDWAS